jgi:hypothetical protein
MLIQSLWKFIAFLLILAFHGGSLSADPGRELSFLYERYAREAFELGEISRAKDLLGRSLEFYSDNSNSLYLLALVWRNELPEFSASLLKQALDADAFSTDAPEVRGRATILLAELYYQTRRYAEALDWLNNHPYLSNYGRKVLLAKIYIKTGQVGRAYELLREELAENEDDEDLIQILLEIDKPFRKEVLRDALSRRRVFSPDIIIKLVFSEEGAASRSELLALYKNLGGQNIRAEILRKSLESNTPLNLMDPDIIHRQENLYLLSEVLSEDEQKDFLADFRQYSGTVMMDRDGDGYSDGYSSYLKGLIQSVSIDRNQNGIAEWVIQFHGPTVSAIYAGDGRDIVFHYRRYPELRQIEIVNGKCSTVYLFERENFSFGPVLFQGDIPFTVPEIKGDVILPDAEDFSSYVSKVQRISGDSTSIDITTDIGTIRDIYKQEGFSSRIHLIGDIPQEGSIDLDNDGTYEVREIYESGEKVKIIYDANNNGITEYLILFQNGMQAFWDYDEDGVFDYTEVLLPEEGVTGYIYPTDKPEIFFIGFPYSQELENSGETGRSFNIDGRTYKEVLK